MLNSRTSVLAAANPVFGRYDDMKSPGENIDFQVSHSARIALYPGIRAHARPRSCPDST